MNITYFETDDDIFYFTGIEFEVNTRATTKEEAIQKLQDVGFKVTK